MIIGGLGVIGVYEYVEPRGRVLARKGAPKSRGLLAEVCLYSSVNIKYLTVYEVGCA